uniref:Uncharacterized protein n=1 Tax=Arundo donax TaxID=35708 RepID=A0A0A9CZK9_ARUDO
MFFFFIASLVSLVPGGVFFLLLGPVVPLLLRCFLGDHDSRRRLLFESSSSPWSCAFRFWSSGVGFPLVFGSICLSFSLNLFDSWGSSASFSSLFVFFVLDLFSFAPFSLKTVGGVRGIAAAGLELLMSRRRRRLLQARPLWRSVASNAVGDQ